MQTDPAPFEFGAVFDAVDIGIVVLDEQRRVTGWNEWIARISGFTKQAVSGRNFYDVFAGAQDSRLGGVIDDCFECGSSSILTHSLNTLLPLKGENGEPVLHNIIVRPVWTPEAKFCLLQINDVTIAVTRERLLRERQNARYRAIVDSAPDAIITTNEDGAIQWLNGEAENAFGYTAQELVGKPIGQLLDQGAGPRTFPLSAADKPVSIQVLGRSKQGTVANFAVSYAQWKADGRSFVTTIWRDVTDLVEARNALLKANQELEARVAKRTQEREVALMQLHQSQKMESIGQLTGGMAHDFNNLLSVILGNLSLLKKAVPNEPRIARLLQGAIQGAERGATLTKRLLAFSRRQDLKLEAIEIQKLLPDMMDFLRQSTGSRVGIVMDIKSDVRPVSIDANQLELAIMNLVLNARDAMPDGGTVTITGRNAGRSDRSSIPDELAAGEYVRLSIADTGEGMDEETLAKATEPFFTTKGVGKGTGLGLSMVHGLTTQSGGALRISSAPGVGTVVTLWLPLAKSSAVKEAQINSAAVLEKPSRENMKILLVDDDVLVRMGAADMLMDLGHSVVEAGSGSEALRRLQSEGPFDLVITDFSMPGMSGLDLALKIGEIDPKLPLLLATGYAELPSRTNASRFARLGKPYTQEQLAQALKAAMSVRVSA